MEYNNQRSKIAKAKKLSLKKLLILIIILCLCMGIGVFFIISYFRSDSYFTKQIQERANTPQNLLKNYDYLLSRSNSLLQYLMLLKRLDTYNMNAKFQNALYKALQDYFTVELQALALDQQLYNNDFSLFSAFSFNIVDIYQQYPALARYYLYIRYQNVDISTTINTNEKIAFLHNDEFLRYIYFFQEYTYTIHDYYLLYNLTKKEIFQFIIYIYYVIKGDSNMSSILFTSISDVWKKEYKDLIKRGKSVFSYDSPSKILPAIVNADDSFYAIALDLYSKDTNSALLYLDRIIETYGIEDLDNNTLELYFWLSRNFSKKYDVKRLNDLFLKVENRLHNSVFLILQYILYLYKINPEEGKQVLEVKASHFSTQVIESPYIQYITILLKGYDVQYQNVFLQQVLENLSFLEDTSLFFDMLSLRAGKMVSYYDNNMISLFFSQYAEFEDILFPYKMYYLLENESIQYLNKDERENLILLFHSKDTSWWNMLNVAIWNIEQKNYATALQYLQYSQNILPYFNDSLQIQYLIQYIRIAILQKNYDLAELYIESLQKLQRTNYYVQLLQNMLEQSKTLYASEISTDSIIDK